MGSETIIGDPFYGLLSDKMPSEIRFSRHFVGKKTVKRAFSFLFGCVFSCLLYTFDAADDSFVQDPPGAKIDSYKH